jgi:hypothetical protein
VSSSPRWLCGAVALGAACSPAAPIDAPIDPPATIDTHASAPVARASGWHYHPPEVSEAVDGHRMADGRWLVVGELGERWVVEGPSHALVAEAASSRAPETLTKVLRWHGEGGSWLFLGRSGTVYLAHKPLGPLTPSARAPRAITDVATTKAGAHALDRLGGRLRFDGASWTPEASGPRLFLLASASSGSLIGMSLPEAMWRSDDDGATWAKLAMGPVGTRRLERGGDGVVLAHGAVGVFRVARDGSASPREGEPPAQFQDLAPVPKPGPSAYSIIDGNASLSEGHYIELLRDEDEHPWRMRSGQLGKPLRESKPPLDPDCVAALVAGSGAHLWIGCAREHDGDTRIELLHSEDGGETLRAVSMLESAVEDRVAIAVASDGTAWVTAACPVSDKAGSQAPCEPGPPVAVRPDGRITRSRAPDLVGAPFEPAVSRDGRRVYFLGERAKDERIALFTASDGRSFAVRSLAPPKGFEGPWDDDPELTRHLSVGADGAVGVAIDGEPVAYVVADRSGEVRSVARLPEHTVAVGGHGRHALALTTLRRDGQPLTLKAWESNDAGLSFRAVPLPMVLELDELQRTPVVACEATGCVIGGRLTRLGWNREAATSDILRRPQQPESVVRPAVRTPISCSIDGSPITIDHLVHAESQPGPTAVMRGNAVWSLFRADDARGEVESIAMLAFDDREPKLERRRLFTKVPDRSRWAYAIVPQMEGHAAVRLPLPKPRGALAGSAMRGLEVAWVNDLAPTVARSTIADAGPLVDEDVTPGQAPHLVVGLVSIAPKGMIVRPSDERTDTWYFDDKGRSSGRASYPSWPATTYRARSFDGTLIDGTPVAAASYHLPGEVGVLSLTPMTAPTNTTFTTVLVDGGGRDVFMDWTYRDGRSGVITQILDPAAGESIAYFAPFMASGQLGEPVPAPTQRDVGDLPRPCTEADRRQGTRVLTKHEIGTRHPLLVREDVDTVTMLTGAAVLYATADTPCLAAWHAHSFGRGPRRIAVIGGDAKSGWLFVDAGARSVSYRRLSCEATPDAALPATYWNQSNTVERVR